MHDKKGFKINQDSVANLIDSSIAVDQPAETARNKNFMNKTDGFLA